jgi:1,2-phenylacetyl-CoA epoxidase catalytic subunit
MNDAELIDYVMQGGRLTAPGNVTPRYRAELMRLMASFVDSELAGAAGFADCINDGPGIAERIAASRIVLEKLDSADKVLRIMAEFGADTGRYVGQHPWAARLPREADIGTRRQAGDMRLNVLHYPIRGWADAVAMNVLMGWATVITLRDYAYASYQPLAEAMRAILPVEIRHAETGEAGLRALAADKAALQASVDYWYPRVAASFGTAGSPRVETLRRYGLRHSPNEDLLARWRDSMAATLGELGLRVG